MSKRADVTFWIVTSDATTVLRRWHAAVNAGDVEAVAAMCSENVAVAGPRGVGHGRDLVRAWLVCSGIRLEPQEDLVERDGRVVVRETARWATATAPGGTPIEPATTWCVHGRPGAGVLDRPLRDRGRGSSANLNEIRRPDVPLEVYPRCRSTSQLPDPLVRAADHLADYGHDWFICGGWATDLLLGHQTRDHLDVDIQVFHQDQSVLRSHLDGWRLLGHDNAVAEDCPDQWDGRWLEPPAHIHANTEAMAGTELDIQICQRAGGEWILSTEPRITLPEPACRGVASWGDLPVVSAQIIVYFKAIPPRYRTNPLPARRAHDEQDFDALLPTLNPAERTWLRTSIAAHEPNHDWLSRL